METVKLWNSEFYKVPVTLLTVGVHAGSAGPVFYSAEVLQASADSWNGVVVTLEHPPLGVPGWVWAFQEGRGLGFLTHVVFDENKLKGQVWLSAAALENASELKTKILNGEKVEVSTGLQAFVVSEQGEWQGESYSGRVFDMRPDHVALLPNSTGACSVADGCGLFNQEERWISNPYPNEHAARIADPDEFEPESFRRKSIAPGITLIVARRKGKSSLEGQAYRFDKNRFTEAEAKKWLKEHGVEYKVFEKAQETQNVKGGLSMSPEEQVSWLISQGCCFQEEDKEQLLQLPQSVLDKLVQGLQKVPPAQPVQNDQSASRLNVILKYLPELEGKTESEIEEFLKTRKLVANKLSYDEWKLFAPPEVVEDLEFARSVKQKQKEEIANQLVLDIEDPDMRSREFKNLLNKNLQDLEEELRRHPPRKASSRPVPTSLTNESEDVLPSLIYFEMKNQQR